MKDKLLYIPVITLLFLGCSTKTIKIDSRDVVYEERPPSYEVIEPIAETNMVSSEIPYEDKSIVPTVSISNPTPTPFNIAPLDAFDKMLENPNLLILDVRSAEEILTDGKIAHSVLIPLPVLGQNLNRLDKSKEIIVYCHSGNRSKRATTLLRENGFEAMNLLGGIKAWKRNHLAVERK